MNKAFRNSILLFITAAIWGFAFVAQSIGGDALGPLTFNFLRFFLGALVLVPVISIKHAAGKDDRKPVTKKDKKTLIIGGILCGLTLCTGSCLQQFGIHLGTSAGKAGFLTSFYILIVPIIGLFFKKKCGINVWIGVVIALAGLYLLCIKQGFTIEKNDLIVFLCAFGFSVQIMLVDHFSPLTDGVRLSAIQFLTAGIVSFILSMIFEMKLSISALVSSMTIFVTDMTALIPVLYAGLFSCGVAYTLQIIAQDGLNPTVASLIMSFESVFSVIGGWLILHEKLSRNEIIGCILVFVAIVLAQIEFKKKAKTTS